MISAEIELGFMMFDSKKQVMDSFQEALVR